MAAFQHLLQRLGFVKLDRFGLALTPDGRIRSTRPAVLDDGAGGRIVGWEDTDLAAAELPSLLPVQNPALRPPGHRFIAPPASPPAVARARPPAIPPAIPAASAPTAAPAPPSAGVISQVVAGEVAVDEDDWEWTIALARARAEDPAPRAMSSKTLPMAAVAAPVVATATATDEPATQPASDYDDYAVVQTRSAIPIPRITRQPASEPPAATPSTVIPVPTLPTVRGTANATRLAPVVRAASAKDESPRRFPKGTGPHDPPTSRTKTRTMPAVPERSVLARASADEPTQVGLALPPAARVVGLPSIKR